MNRIALFVHAGLGPEPQIQQDHAIGVLTELVQAVVGSGLRQQAEVFEIGVNGGLPFCYTALLIAPTAKVKGHPHTARSELPTLARLQRWLPDHPGWSVCYCHTKGASRPGDPLRDAWRRCMTRHVIWNWRKCVADLEAGADSVGCHWMTPERWGAALLPTKTPYWGGNFFWAKASFLLTLPKLTEDEKSMADFYLPERWIGEGPRRPAVRDYHPNAWPSLKCAYT